MSDRSNFQASKKVLTVRRAPLESRQFSKDLPQQLTPTPALLRTLVDHPAKLSAGDFLNLQRTVGNSVVRRLLAQGQAQRQASRTSTLPQIQTKLTVGAANDIYEQEADRVATQLMSIPESRFKSSASKSLRRQRAAGEEPQQPIDDKVLMRPLADITPLRRQFREESETRIRTLTKPRGQAETNVQTKSSSDGSFEVSSKLEQRINATRGGGNPLSQGTREFMEPRFGSDFSAVRIHTNTEAAQMNRSLSAHAFTHGTDIYMGEGKYNPGSDAGKLILAHELTHVVQQTGRRSRSQATSAPKLTPVVSTVTRLNRSTLQRWNAAIDDPYAPTHDRGHPALANIFILPLGPYKFYPMQGEFKYQPPQLGGAFTVENLLKRLIKHKDPNAIYPPEQIASTHAVYNWVDPNGIKNGGNPIHFHPNGITHADPAKRVLKATHIYNTQLVGTSVASKVFENMQGYHGGAKPRPFVSVAAEDAYGAAAHAHTTSRHVLGGADVPNADAVAARAAFGLLGGIVAGQAKGAYAPTSTAFKTAADADTDVGNAINTDLKNNWKQHRIDLINNGVINLRVARAGGQIEGYETLRPGMGPWSIALKPTYLVANQRGEKPLFYPDNRWDAWAGGGGGAPAALKPTQIAARKKQPLSKDVAGNLGFVNVRILASDVQAHQGWFVHSAFPVY